ncbi:MAG: protease modulator HflC, partial [Gammaproteobacteria bacterium]
TETYAAAFSKDKEFYAMYRSLSAYQNSFSGQNDILLISPDSDFFKYFNHPQGR